MAKFTGGIEVQGSSVLSGGVSDLGSGTITNTHLSATAAIDRSKLAQDNNAKFGIPFHDCRVWNAPHTLLGSAGSSDDLGIANGSSGYGNDCLRLITSDIDGTSVTQYARFMFVLPHNYVDAQTIAVQALAGMTTATSGATTLEIDCHTNVSTGNVGTDLGPAAQSINSTTFATKTFTISESGRAAGDYLDFRIKITGTDDGTGGTKYAAIEKLYVTCDVKG